MKTGPPLCNFYIQPPPPRHRHRCRHRHHCCTLPPPLLHIAAHCDSGQRSLNDKLIAGAALTVPATQLFGPACAPVPQWTWAFNATTLAFLLCVKPLAGAAAADPSVAIGLGGWLCAPLVGVSQIFVVGDLNCSKVKPFLLAGTAISIIFGFAKFRLFIISSY